MLPGEAALRSIARRLRARMPSVFAGLDVAIPRRRPPWGGPMNGQHGRQEIVRALVNLRKPVAIVETGTYLGVTTEYLALLTGVEVRTCESQSIYYRSALKRFRDNPLVRAELADSVDFLKALAADRSVPKRGVLFYLDAHWDANLPLRDEMEIIGQSWQEPWILIDDFRVPADPGYGFDDYGEDAALQLSYLAPAPWWTPLFPALPSAQETGARRGCVVLVPPNQADSLVATGLLRRP